MAHNNDTHYVRPNLGVLDETNRICFTRDGPEPFEQFPYEDVFDDLDGPQPEEPDRGVDELRDLLQFVWETPGDLDSARPRFKALASEVLKHPEPPGRGAQGFARLIRYCFGKERRPIETAWRIFVAITATVRPELTGGRGYAPLATQLGISKAATSKAARQFQETFNFHAHESRSEQARARMAEAASEAWRRRHANQ